MKLLILSFYFPPDLSAGSFRTRALVDALRRQHPGIEIDVITTEPNRYQSHAATAQADADDLPGVTVTRIPLRQHRSGMLDQSRVFIGFARHVLRLTRGRRWPLVYATSSRLMTAALGAVVAKRAGAALYLDIRDLFTDTMRDVLATSPLRHILGIFDLVERYTFRAAKRVNLVSEGFLDHARRVAPEQTFSTFTNGIDPEFLSASFEKAEATDSTSHILYAGNIGEGQGLHAILPGVARALEGKAQFTIIGDGGRRTALVEALEAAGIGNVTMRPPVPRAQLFRDYAAADILFLHLNDHPAFLKVLPSKLFEYAATGKPILAGVGGYAARFIRENIEGSAVFAPCDVEGMIAAIEALRAAPASDSREAFKAKFAREAIMDRMALDIISLVREEEATR